jgi:WD40 repeat protein
MIKGLEDSTFLCLSAEGNRFVTGSTDKSVQVYEIGSGKELHRFVDHGMKVNCVAWLSGKENVFSGSEDKYIKVWSLEKLSNIASISCGKPVKCLTSKVG